ncbi:TPA: hypothetical protein MBF18_003556 [Klebsiella pneumoniae]|nr:hypothetical protein [Klebsiella pneumoniae]
MSIHGRDFLTASKSCVDSQCESGYRGAISRSYYALYHEICATLRMCPPTTHEGVVLYLTTDARRKDEPYEFMSLVQLGAVLKQQKAKRKMADYELSQSITELEAKASISVVDKMITKIDTMRSNAA